MKVIDAKNAVLGRIASYAAKEALKGEEVIIVNSEQAIITGNKESIKMDFHKKRSKMGSGQRGPKHLKSSDRIVKRTIRGMLPNFREGRGRDAFKRIKCYIGAPKEFENAKKIVLKEEKKIKFSKVGEFSA